MALSKHLDGVFREKQHMQRNATKKKRFQFPVSGSHLLKGENFLLRVEKIATTLRILDPPMEVFEPV